MNRNRYAKLKGKMVEKGFTQAKLASDIGISVQSLNSKINGKTEFSVTEMGIIARTLELEDPIEIFFT